MSKGFVISLVKLSKRRNGKGGCPWWHFFILTFFFKKIAKITCGRKYFQNLARFAAPRAMAPQHNFVAPSLVAPQSLPAWRPVPRAASVAKGGPTLRCHEL